MRPARRPAAAELAPLHWVKLWRAESSSFAQLPLVTRGIAAELLKICDRDGRIFVGNKKPWDAIAFALGANQGDRRALRSAIPELVADGYLVEDGEWVRVKNFCAWQGIDGAKLDHDPAARSQRADHELITSPQRARNENEDKPLKSLERDAQEKRREEERRGEGEGPSQRDAPASLGGSDLGLLPTAPTSAKVRGALVRGYRDAFEAAYKTLPTDIQPAETDGAVFAIQARADVTGQDPVRIAANVAAFWIAQRPPWREDHRKLPRWRYFLADLGAMLTQVPPAEVAQ